MQMDALRKLEGTMASWYKGLPHLPDNFRKWLADNIWWLVLVGVVLGLLTVIPAFWVFLFGGVIMTATYGVSGDAYYGGAFVVTLLVLLFVIANMVLSGLAIVPLKAHRKFGWQLLFLVVLVQVLSTVVTFAINFSFGALITGLLGAAIAGYFLFEIRSYYGVTTRLSQPETKKT